MGGVDLHVHTCACARADVPPFPYVVNGWMDCDEIWYVVREPLARHLTEVSDGVQLHRTCTRSHPFPYLRNGWTDCAEIWYHVVRNPLVWRFTKVNGGIQVHVRTPFRILGTARRTVLRLGV